MIFKVKRMERKLEYSILMLYKKKQWRKSAKLRIKKERNEKVLTDEQKMEIRAFYKKYAKLPGLEEHEFYTQKTGEYHKEYLPDWLYYSIIDSTLNDWDAAVKIDNKVFYEFLFPDCIQPYSIAYRINNLWFSHDRNIISFEEVENLISQEDVLFIKAATDSNGGHGVYRVSSQKDIVDEAVEAIGKIKQDIVIQRAIQQSETLASINRTSVNTIRVLSLLHNQQVMICSMILRLGVGSSYVDNASSGGITVGIKEDGGLKKYAFNKNGTRFQTHPTSGVCFETITIPSIDGIRALVKRLHPLLPYFKNISWDIALDKNDSPVLVEANMKDGELDFHQLNNGPLFGEKTAEILDEVFGIISKEKSE